MPATSLIDLVEAKAFLLQEARLLDERRYLEWLNLFTADCYYWVPSEHGQPDPFETVSLMYDDRRLLETRVRRLTGTWLHAQDPVSHTSRIIDNVTAEAVEDGAIVARSKLLMVEARRNQQRLFAGTVHHRLVVAGNGLQIAWKKVELINCDFELDGLVVPF